MQCLTPLGQVLECLLAFHGRRLSDQERPESLDELHRTVPAGGPDILGHSSSGYTLFSSYYPTLESESAQELETEGSIPQAGIRRAWQALCRSLSGKSNPWSTEN
jgi:hypothetical protein